MKSYLLPLLVSCLLLLVSPRAEGEPFRTEVVSGSVCVVLADPGWAVRSEEVATWLAEELASMLPASRSYSLRVERRSMDVLIEVDPEGVLLLHPRLPSASRDEELQVLVTALWLLLSDELGSDVAWERALELVAPRRPAGWAPRWWPRCCDGLDGMHPPHRRVDLPQPTTEALRDAYGRADLYGGFRLPLGGDWPWVVGAFGIYAPVARWELVGALEAMPLGLVEARLGAGYAHQRRSILRLNGGPLVAWNLGSAMGEEQHQPGLEYPAGIEAGLWADVEAGGWRALARFVDAAQPGLDGWVGWERRLTLSERWHVLPFGRARFVSETLPQRALSMGGPTGVRWMDVDAMLTHRTAVARFDVEHVIPTGRMPGPAWLRPRAILLRAGADCGFAPEHGFVGGWAGAVGLALHPLAEIKGVGWLTVAAPSDWSSLTWIVWLSTWLPQP